MKKVMVAISFICCFATLPGAQTSSTYQNKEHVINAGGNPAPALSSTNYQVTLSSIGNGLAQTGMSSSSYRMDGSFLVSYPPPGEVLNLLFSSISVFGWDPEVSVGSYDVYRGDITDLQGGSSGICLTSGITLTQATDGTVPPPGHCFFFIVTARNRLDEEGTMGSGTAGERVISAPCT